MTYHIIVHEREFKEIKESNNLFDIIDIIERFKKIGMKVSVVNGSIMSSKEFIESVGRLYK